MNPPPNYSPLSNLSCISPTYLDPPLISAAQAQHLLQRIGWTYFTIWKTYRFDPGLLAWSDGNVIPSYLPQNHNDHRYEASGILDFSRGSDFPHSQQIIKARETGCLLQQFYKKCSFLPVGFGIAGRAMQSGRYQWASDKELLEQIMWLSSHNRQLDVPADLRQHLFKTVVCIPLQNGAGVLEMGTEALVPEATEGNILSDLMKGLATYSSLHVLMGEKRIFNAGVVTSGSGVAPSCNMLMPTGQPSSQDQCRPEEHYNRPMLNMQTCGGRPYLRQTSMSSSYCSSSPAASSPPSLDHQKASMNSTAPPPNVQINTRDLLNIAINQSGFIELHTGSGISKPPALICHQQQYGAAPYITDVGSQHLLRQLHQRAFPADHHMSMQRYAGGRSAVEEPCVPRAFRSWSRSSFALSCERNQNTALGLSLWKKLLIYYRGKLMYMRAVDERATRSGAGGLLQAQEPTVQLDHQWNVLMGTRPSESTQNEERKNLHVYAERNRRSKQAECYKTLRNLVPDLPKTDKVGVLHHSVQYLRHLMQRVDELEKPLDHDVERLMKNSGQRTFSHAALNATVRHIDGNCFQLNVNKIIKHEEEANMNNMKILGALQQKSLQCSAFTSKFEDGTIKLHAVEVLAKYKEVENRDLSLERIREIKEWWPSLMQQL